MLASLHLVGIVARADRWADRCHESSFRILCNRLVRHKLFSIYLLGVAPEGVLWVLLQEEGAGYPHDAPAHGAAAQLHAPVQRGPARGRGQAGARPERPALEGGRGILVLSLPTLRLPRHPASLLVRAFLGWEVHSKRRLVAFSRREEPECQRHREPVHALEWTCYCSCAPLIGWDCYGMRVQKLVNASLTHLLGCCIQHSFLALACNAFQGEAPGERNGGSLMPWKEICTCLQAAGMMCSLQ